MKKYLFYAAAALVVTALAGCKNDNLEEGTPQDSGINGEATMTLEVSSDNVVLDKTKLDETALTFTWTAARELPEEYVLTYTTELDIASSENYATADKKELKADELSLSYTTKELQALLVDKWEQSVGLPVKLKFRVTASWTGGTEKAEPEVQTKVIQVAAYNDESKMALTVTPEGAVTLDEAKPDETALTFSWTAAREVEGEYELSYKAALSLTEDGTKTAEKTLEADKLEASYTTKELQDLIVNTWGQTAGETVSVKFTVTASWTAAGDETAPAPEICSADVEVTTYVSSKQTMELTFPEEEIVLEEGKGDETALTFSWTAAREMPDGYELSYKVELDLESNNFAEAVSETLDSEVLTKSYTVSELQTLITDTWGQPSTEAASLSFRVTASWTGGTETPEPEMCVGKVTVRPYPVSEELEGFAVSGVRLGGEVLDAEVEVSKTVECELDCKAVYAAVQSLGAGGLTIPVTDAAGETGYLCPADGNGAFKDGTPVAFKVMNLPEEWSVDSPGDYRVVVNATDKTVTIYSPENEFNKNYTLDWYIAGKPENHPNQIQGTEVKEIWLRGTWDVAKNSWGWGDGQQLPVVQSAADPQVFIYEGEGLNSYNEGESKSECHFAIIQSIKWDSGGKNEQGTLIGETTWNINNVPVIAPKRTDGSTSKIYVDAEFGKWLNCAIGSEYRETFWSIQPDGVNFIVIDLRNMRVWMEMR